MGLGVKKMPALSKRRLIGRPREEETGQGRGRGPAWCDDDDERGQADAPAMVTREGSRRV